MRNTIRKRASEQINLVALLLIFILPFAVVVYQLIAEINASTNFARQELHGTAYLRPLQTLLETVPQNQLLAHRYSVSGTGEPELNGNQMQVDTSFKELASVDQQLGAILGTTKLSRALQEDWNDLKRQVSRLRSNPSIDRSVQLMHRQLITDIRALIAHVGDRSKLILDPDLDSYYLMDAVLLKLPERQDLLTQVQLLGEDILRRGRLTPEERGQLIVFAGLLEANLNATRSGMRVAFQNNPSQMLKPVLEKPLAASLNTTSAFGETLNQLIEAQSVDVAIADYDAAATKALAANSQLWDITATQLDGLLQARIDRFSRKTYIIEVFALLVLAAVSTIFVAFYGNLAQRRQTQRRLNAQHATTRVLAESLTLDEATPRVLQTICESLGWEVGELWSIDPHRKVLRLVQCWQTEAIASPELDQVSRSLTFAIGEGLPGRVWQQGQAIWIGDVAQDEEFQRGSLITQLGLHVACGFPILMGDSVVAVMSFFSRSLQRSDPELLKMMSAIGTQVGQFIQRNQTESALQDIAHGVSAATGAAFFHTLVHKLVTALQVDYAFVGERVEGGEKIHTVAVCAQGETVNNFQYDLDDTACATVVGQELRYYPFRVSQRFPEDTLLRRMKMECYMGTPLFSSTGQPLGLLAVMSRKPLAGQQLAESMLKIFATRAAAELERNHAEEALRQSEALQRMALTAARMGAWDWNIATGAETWSKEVETIFGLTVSSLGRTYEDFLNLVHPDDREQIKQAQARALHEGAEYSPEYRIISSNGSERWVSSRGKVLRDDAGNPLRLTGVTMDITDRKRMELALAESEWRLRQQSQALTNLAHHRSLSAGNLEQALQAITEVAAEPLQVERTIVWLYNSDRSKMQCADLYERSTHRHSAGMELAIADYPIYFGRLSANRVIATNDIQQEPMMREFWPSYFRPLGINASLDAPIIVGATVVGLVCHEHVGATRQWTLTEQNFAGSIADFIALAIEASERKRTETALRRAEEKYRSIFENAVSGIFQTTAKGHYLSANPALARIYGYASPEELIAELTSVELYVDPDRRSEFVRLMQAQDAVTAFESQVYRRDGKVIWIAESARAVRDERGNLLYYEGTVEDITVPKCLEAERQSAEAVLKRQLAAIEASIDGISIANAAGQFVYMNQAHAEIYGYDSPSELIGQSWSVLYRADELRRFQQEIMPLFQQEGRWRGESVGKRRDGSTYPQEVSLTAVQDGLVCVVQDITQRKRVEEALRESKEAAEEANRAKSQFLANMSHELRTPLNAIIGYSEMLQEDAEDFGYGDIIPDLEKIRGAGKHLLALINDILDISKIEAGKMELYLETFDLSTLIYEVQTTIEPLVDKNGNRLQIQCPDELSTMHADLTKVRQILLNLLSNAAKFTEQGTITLTVELGNGEAEGADRSALSQLSTADAGCLHSWISFKVTDTGIGMSLEQMEKVFQAFTQADASTTRKYGGTGLGLAISRRFCQMMGGDISVASKVGAGSTFTIHLPLEVSASPVGLDAAVKSAEADRDPHALETVHQGTLLVIDDDPTVCKLMTHYLVKEGFRVEVASTAEEGMQLARELRPDAITLDVLLPGANGWTVLSTLKADPDLADIPVIVMTIVDDKNLGFALGASDYLTKPIDYKRLTKLLRSYRPQSSEQNVIDTAEVLVVEDDTTTRTMFRQILQREGWTVTEAANGRLALEQLKLTTPDLILLDLMMPEMDGFQFVSALRQHSDWRSLPILVVTAMDLTPGDRLALNGYVEQILQKGSYSRDDLLREVRDLVITCIRHRVSGRHSL